MSLLSDSEIAGLIGTEPPLVSDIDPTNHTTKDAPIQASSVDLTIGGLFVPGTPDNQLGGTDMPHRSISLLQGEMAVVRTKEKLALPADIAGFGFPPSRLSIGGLLVTNPGHVDPGYQGHLQLTVINMGRHPTDLKQGQAIMTLLFIRLSRPAVHSFSQRRSGRTGSSPIDQVLLMRLSRDFLDVQQRAQVHADKQINEFERRQNTKINMIAAFGALALVIAPFILESWTGSAQRFTELEHKVELMAAQSSLVEEFELLSRRVEALEASD